MILRKKTIDKTVFFLHIPKCAGITLLAEVIQKKYRPKESILFYGHSTEALIRMLQQMSQKQQKKIKCIAGHFAYGVHEFYKARPPAYITLLRDPIDRVISHYYYVMRTEDHYLHKMIKEENLSLKEYVEKNLSIELNNGQTRILAGIGSDAVNGECSEAMLNQAKQNLAAFTAVGISERFDAFMELLNNKLGWKIPQTVRHNAAPHRLTKEDLDRETLKTIEEHNTYDIELYRYVCDMFLQKCQPKT